MQIRLITLPGCPGAAAARELLHQMLADLSIDAEVEELLLEDQNQVGSRHFPGSPSIQINGLDIELDKRDAPSSYSCRTYEQEDGQHLCRIPEILLREALQRAQQPNVALLYLCTGNSCRSQMAEGWTRHLRGDYFDVYSAGIETHGLNPEAVQVMAEAGVDISSQSSERIDQYLDAGIDYVVTVCSHAHETCPMFPGRAQVIHVGFDDPPALAAEANEQEAQLDCYRRVRDEIRKYVKTLPDSLPGFPNANEDTAR